MLKHMARCRVSEDPTTASTTPLQYRDSQGHAGRLRNYSKKPGEGKSRYTTAKNYHFLHVYELLLLYKLPDLLLVVPSCVHCHHLTIAKMFYCLFPSVNSIHNNNDDARINFLNNNIIYNIQKYYIFCRRRRRVLFFLLLLKKEEGAYYREDRGGPHGSGGWTQIIIK